MPAVVRSTDGSCTEGTSDAEGTIMWSRSSKNSRYVLRISSAFIGPSLRSGAPDDRPVAHHEVAVQQAGELSWGHAVDRLGQGDGPTIGPLFQLKAARPAARVVAEADCIHPIRSPVQLRPADANPAR